MSTVDAQGGGFVPYTDEVQTPNLNELVRTGIELNRQYVYKYCSPTRSALQSGRNPYHVNNLNLDPTVYNPADPVSVCSVDAVKCRQHVWDTL